MNRTILIAVALAVLLATAGVAAAAPGAANGPADVNESNDRMTNASEDRPHADAGDDRPADAADRAGSGAEDRADQGPPSVLPDQVPDHVSAIHERISSFLNGDLETTLGDAIADVTPGSADDDRADGDDAVES